MSGQAPITPAVMDTTILQVGQPPGSISPLDAQLMEDSLSGMTGALQTASFTLATTDRGTRIRYNSASAGVCTIPTNATVPAQLGCTIMFCQLGAGQLTITPAAGVTLQTPSTGNVTTRTRWAHIWIVQDSANGWIAGGDLT